MYDFSKYLELNFFLFENIYLNRIIVEFDIKIQVIRVIFSKYLEESMRELTYLKI